MGWENDYNMNSKEENKDHLILYNSEQPYDQVITEELQSKYAPEGSTLRRAQLRMLEMLMFIDAICEENGLTYWLDSGTLLGALRHHGFIPWDDDTDICMPRKDAKKFKEIMLKKQNSGDFVIQCRETDPGFFGAWIVLRDTKTEYFQDGEYSLMHNKRRFRGLQVDIFDVDDHCIEPLRIFVSRCQNHLIDIPLKKIRNVFLSNIIVTPNYYTLELLKALVRLVSPQRDYYIKPLGVAWKHMLKDNIYPLERIEFEGKYFWAPGDSGAYLTNMYGNWEKIPDVIKTHKVEVLFK